MGPRERGAHLEIAKVRLSSLTVPRTVAAAEKCRKHDLGYRDIVVDPPSYPSVREGELAVRPQVQQTVRDAERVERYKLGDGCPTVSASHD